MAGVCLGSEREPSQGCSCPPQAVSSEEFWKLRLFLAARLLFVLRCIPLGLLRVEARSGAFQRQGWRAARSRQHCWRGLASEQAHPLLGATEENPLLPGLAGQTREPGVLGKGWVWDGSFGAGWDVRGWSVAFQHLGRPPRLLGSVAAPASSGEAELRGVSAGKQAALPLSRAAPSAWSISLS